MKPYYADEPGFTDRFWMRVEKTPDCWSWSGSRTSAGYGNLRLPGGLFGYAHRVSYTLTKGPIPDGLVIDHLCRNRGCVNPDHLEAVPQRTNVVRGMAPYGLRTECKHGHDITKSENVYVQPDGNRRCRECASVLQRQRNMGWKPPTQCPQGHEFDSENTQLTPSGHRRCRECNRARARRAHAKKRSAATSS